MIHEYYIATGFDLALFQYLLYIKKKHPRLYVYFILFLYVLICITVHGLSNNY